MDPYKVLGVAPGADRSEIRKAFHKLSFKHHPDKAGDTEESHEKFTKIQDAYNKLTESSERASPYEESSRDARRADDRQRAKSRTRYEEGRSRETRYTDERPSSSRRNTSRPRRYPIYEEDGGASSPFSSYTRPTAARSPRSPHHQRNRSQSRSYEEISKDKWRANEKIIAIAEDLETHKRNFVALRHKYKRNHPTAYESVAQDLKNIEGNMERNIQLADFILTSIQYIPARAWSPTAALVQKILSDMDHIRTRTNRLRSKIETLEITARSVDRAMAKLKECHDEFRVQVQRF